MEDIDKLLARLFLVVAKDVRHKHYGRTVEQRKKYMQMVAGVDLDKLLKQYVRREDDQLFKQRVALTNHIVTAVCKNLIDPLYKVPRSNSARRVLTYGTESADQDTHKAELEGILSRFWGSESWDDYLATRGVELNAVDPNTIVVMEFKNFDATKELVQPYPYEVNSVMAIDYKVENKILQYLISQEGHQYRIEKPLEKAAQALGSAIPDHSRTHAKGHKYTLYTKNQTFRLLQVHENAVPGLQGLNEGRPAQLGAEGGIFVRLGQAFYLLQVFKPHNLGRVPGVRIGYARDLATEGETFVSSIDPALPYLEKTVKVNSELDLVATLLAHPQLVQYSDVCVADGCYEGETETGPCKVCDGTGFKATAPSSQDAITLKMPRNKEQLIPLDQILQYISPPVDVVKWQEEYIEKLTAKARKIMYGSDIFDRKQIADTATGKNLDYQNVYDSLYPFAVSYGRTWTAGVTIIASLADREKGLVASLTFGKDFKFKTLDSLILDLSTANGIGNPTLLRHINNDIAQIIFSEKPLEHQRYELRELYNPFSGKSEKEVMLLMASPFVPLREKILHANMPRIFDELELEYGKDGKDFYQLKRSKQREAIHGKVEEIAQVLNSENPDPVMPEIGQ